MSFFGSLIASIGSVTGDSSTLLMIRPTLKPWWTGDGAQFAVPLDHAGAVPA